MWLCNIPFFSKIIWPPILEKMTPITHTLQNQIFLTLPNRYFSKILNLFRHVEGGEMLAMQSIAKFGTVGMLNSWLMWLHMLHLEALMCSNLILKTLDYFAKKDSRPISVDVTLISLLLTLYILLSKFRLNTCTTCCCQ